MKVIVFGGSGMVGQAAVDACLKDDAVTKVLSVGRTPLGISHPKLEELAHSDFTDFSAVAAKLKGYDACLFCLGISSAGMKEPEYRKITYDFTLAAAKVLAAQNPSMNFLYVSGEGTDSTAKGRSMWARVKGETENALLGLPFKGAYMFRPGMIRPAKGMKSKTPAYRALYAVMTPLFPVMKALAPKMVTTSEQVGRAMVKVAAHGADKKWIHTVDINELGAA